MQSAARHHLASHKIAQHLFRARAFLRILFFGDRSRLAPQLEAEQVSFKCIKARARPPHPPQPDLVSLAGSVDEADMLSTIALHRAAQSTTSLRAALPRPPLQPACAPAKLRRAQKCRRIRRSAATSKHPAVPGHLLNRDAGRSPPPCCASRLLGPDLHREPSLPGGGAVPETLTANVALAGTTVATVKIHALLLPPALQAIAGNLHVGGATTTNRAPG